jgi:hypothetical protein
MKKIFALVLTLVLCLSLCACGNESWGVGNYNFTHVHFFDGVEGKCATVSSWHDNELGCEVYTKEYGSIYLSEGTYLLIEDGAKCPYCSEVD